MPAARSSLSVGPAPSQQAASFPFTNLVPAIRDADGWGEERANLLAREHVEQRDQFQYILDRLRDTDRASILLGRELLAFVGVLLADMQREEQTVLDADLLRNDVVGIDMETG